MARRRTGKRVRGPYKHGRKWRIDCVDEDGRRLVDAFETEAAAQEVANRRRRQIWGWFGTDEAMKLYLAHLAEKGLKPSSIRNVETRLGYILPELPPGIGDITPAKVEAWYQERTENASVATHRGDLGCLKTFLGWSMAEGLVHRNPAEAVKAVGRPRRGKPQLRRGEARAFWSEALRMAENGSDAGLAACVILVLGLRSSEILTRKVRDVDSSPDGTLLWIPEGKTDAAARVLEVPSPLAELLAKRARGRPSDDWLFPSYGQEGHKLDCWLRWAVGKICQAVKVPVVCTHGLRGTWATLARGAGVAAHIVAKDLGHESYKITQAHYLAPGAEEGARTRTIMRMVQGGKE